MKILLILLKFNNMEIWKTITDYPNYQVSNYGNVKNIRFNRIVRVYKYYGYNVRFGYSNDKIKLKDNIIVKIKNNIVVETIK